ncbi:MULTISPECIES: IS66 family transposase [Vibrio]|uniref:IS66 family transposase n=1 Tax=Vibrio TaxID=662 RepID=UPI00068066AA|nr:MULTISPECIES: transposase [Vibrio]MDE3898444.1 transposase [Vibrio sp. CC007]
MSLTGIGRTTRRVFFICSPFRARRKPKRQPLLENLPRVVSHHEQESIHCPDCGDELHTIGEGISEKLIFSPAKVEVEQQGELTAVYQASMATTVLPKSFATPSLVAQITVMKFQYGLPLTRIESLFGDWSIDISRRTLADWSVQGAEILECVWAHLRSICSPCRRNACQSD